jgi:hypothetical protein
MTLTDLQNIVSAATSGSWLLEHPKLKHYSGHILANCEHCEEEPFVLAELNRNMDSWPQDAKYIATFNPKLVGLLLAEVVAQREMDALDDEATYIDWDEAWLKRNKAREALDRELSRE